MIFFDKIAVRDRRRDFGDVTHLAGQVAGHRIHRIGQIFPRAGHAFHIRLAAEFSFRAHFARDARHFRGERAELIDHRVDRVLQLQNLALHIDGDLLREIARRDRGGDLRNVAHLAGQVAGHEIHRIGQILPRAGNAFDARLAAENSFRTDFARHARHFRGERAELIHHDVDRVLQLEELAFDVDRDFLGQVAVRDRRRDRRNVTHLRGQVARHQVHVLGQILPGAGDAFDLRLTAEFAFRAHFARHARHFRGKRAELIDHRVHRLGRAQKLALRTAGLRSPSPSSWRDRPSPPRR